MLPLCMDYNMCCSKGMIAAAAAGFCSLKEIGGFERHFVSTDSSVRLFVDVRKKEERGRACLLKSMLDSLVKGKEMFEHSSLNYL